MNIKLKGAMQYAAVVSAICGVVSAVLYGILSTDGESSSPVVYICLIAGVALNIVIFIIDTDKEYLITVLNWAAALLNVFALALFITERVQWLYALFSKMEAAPLTMLFPATIVLFVITIVSQNVSQYLPYKKRKGSENDS